MDKLIGREREWLVLDEAFHSSRSELILLRGRRRVGKTFLVRSYFQDYYTFHFVGRYNKSKKEQLEAFRYELGRACGNPDLNDFTCWKDAFRALESYLEQSKDERKVIFLDELPWMDRYGNELIQELEDFWNAWATNRNDIVLVACGSATAWMRNKFEKNRGGLHRRITHRIYLRPFYLNEVKAYLEDHHIDWDDYQIMQCYMALGGVPYYLSLLKPYLSLPENIDNLMFRRGGELKDEFEELFPALFTKADKYVQTVRLLSGRRSGYTRQEIEKAINVSGGTLTTLLENLEDCDFVSRYAQYGNKERDMLYRLSDMYLLFFFRYVDGNNSMDEQFWLHNFNSRSVESWEGFAFEALCFLHLPQIKKSLGISGVATTASTWRYAGDERLGRKGAQIDLVIKRADGLHNLVEMKFARTEYEMTKDYAMRLNERRNTFSEVTGVTHGLIDTFVTPKGVKRGVNSTGIMSQVTAHGLFDDL